MGGASNGSISILLLSDSLSTFLYQINNRGLARDCLEAVSNFKVSLVSPFGHPFAIRVHHLISLVLLLRGPDIFRHYYLRELLAVNKDYFQFVILRVFYLLALTVVFPVSSAYVLTISFNIDLG